jgi:uncharacterized phiE125 gp8 family phage protein
MTGTLAKILAPTSWPLSLEDARAFVIIDDDDADHMRVLDLAIRAATQYCETRAGLTAQRTTYQLRLDAWPSTYDCDRRRGAGAGNEIDLPAAPVRDVLSVTYVDTDGIEQTVPPRTGAGSARRKGASSRSQATVIAPTLRSGRKGVVRVCSMPASTRRAKAAAATIPICSCLINSCSQSRSSSLTSTKSAKPAAPT